MSNKLFIQSENFVNLHANFSLSSKAEVMANLGIVVVAPGSRRVEQCSKPILPDISDLTAALLQAFKDIIDIHVADLPETLIHQIRRHLFPGHRKVIALRRKHLCDQRNDIINCVPAVIHTP